MKISGVFRVAAEMMAEGVGSLFCCNSIECVEAAAKTRKKALEYFRGLYHPERDSSKEKEGGWFGNVLLQRNKDRRLIALCLAADIAEQEGL